MADRFLVLSLVLGHQSKAVVRSGQGRVVETMIELELEGPLLIAPSGGQIPQPVLGEADLGQGPSHGDRIGSGTGLVQRHRPDRPSAVESLSLVKRIAERKQGIGWCPRLSTLPLAGAA